jgi:hypothetical protein
MINDIFNDQDQPKGFLFGNCHIKIKNDTLERLTFFDPFSKLYNKLDSIDFTLRKNAEEMMSEVFRLQKLDLESAIRYAQMDFLYHYKADELSFFIINS